MSRTLLATTLFLLLFASPSLADDLILKDGRVLSGVTAEKQGESWLVLIPSSAEGKEPPPHRVTLATANVLLHVGKGDRAGQELVAFARRKEPSEFPGQRVIVTGRLAQHLGVSAAAHLDRAVRAFCRWYKVDPETFKPVPVTVSGTDYRRSLNRAWVSVSRQTLMRNLPKLADAPFPIPALAMLGGSEGDGGLMEAVGAGKVTDLTLKAVYAKDSRVELGWSLIRYLNAASGKWEQFLEVTRTGDSAALRKWLEGIEGLETAWREHVKGWSLTTPAQHVDAAYVALNARRMQRAATLFATAIEKGSVERGAFDGLAEIYVLAGDSGRAMRVWQSSMKADPLNVRARRSIGVYLSEKQSGRVGGYYLQMADDIETALAE